MISSSKYILLDTIDKIQSLLQSRHAIQFCEIYIELKKNNYGSGQGNL